MADQGFDPYHVPQQRRRDKLRFANLQLQGLLPIYDPSLYSSDFMTVGASCTMGGTGGIHNNDCGGGTACTGGGGGGGVKEELGGNFLGYTGAAGGGNFSGGGSNSTTPSVTNHLMYMMDPRSSSSIQLNPSCSIQEMDPNNPFLYNNPQQSSFKFLNHGVEVVVCPPPPAEEELSAAGSTRIMNACSHGLSLSLSSQHHNQQSSTSTTSTLPLELNLQNYEHDPSIYTKKIASFSGTVNELSRNSVPLGPFTGYASVLKGSRFLGPAQQLLEEICDVGEGNYPQKLSAETVMLDPSMENIAKNVDEDSSQQSCNLGSDQRKKKSRLMLLLNEVYKRYKQYCHQMQAVVASFESVAGVKNAAPFASMAVKAMSKHFNFLRNVISDQLQQFLTEPRNSHNNVVAQEKDIAPAPSTYDHTSSATGMFDFVQHQPVWRPQRGLPERAVTILRAWLFDHFLHPYPTDTDKLMLAKQTGLSRNQVSNWFINARVRLWKPMVEEIHMLETRQAQKSSHEDAVSNVHDRESNQLIHAASSTTVPVSSLKTPTSSSVQRIQDNNNIMSLKRGRNEPTAAEKNALLMDRRNYDQNLSAFPQMGFGHVSSGGANGGVSLTLGLQQNNSGSSTRLTDIPFSVSAARRLGLVDPNGEEYVAGGWH